MNLSLNNMNLKVVEKLLNNGEMIEAKKRVEFWRKEDPMSAQAWRATALVYLHDKNYTMALSSIDFAIAFEAPHVIEANLDKADILKAMGEFDKVEDIYNSLLPKVANNNEKLMTVLIEKLSLHMENANMYAVANAEVLQLQLDNIKNIFALYRPTLSKDSVNKIEKVEAFLNQSRAPIKKVGM